MRTECEVRWPRAYISSPRGRDNFTFSWQTGWYLTCCSYQNLKIYVGTEKSVTVKKAKRKYEECYAISQYQKDLTIQTNYSEKLDYKCLDRDALIARYPVKTCFINKEMITEEFQEKQAYYQTKLKGLYESSGN